PLTCAYHRRAVLSFPTRRSSDLLKDSQARVLLTQASLQENLRFEIADLKLLTLDEVSESTCSTQRFDPQSGVSSENLAYVIYTSDRKSTRLNSSHVAISYAVFCL